MSKMVMIGCAGALIVLALVLGLFLVGQYNGLVTGNEQVSEAWSQVENVYQRRADLVPNLVATVKGAAAFEQTTLQNVVEARSRIGQFSPEAMKGIVEDPAKFAAFQKAQDGLSSALSRLMVVVENYPQLKATQAFSDLMVQLEGTENRIAVERRRFNEVARDFNTRLKRFPTGAVSRMLGWSFKEKAYFEAQAGAATAPKVQF